MYFVSNRAGGFGGSDIWRSKIANNIFFAPENLGQKLTQKMTRCLLFIHPDNLTLYFASNGHVGMGDFDIYVSRRNNTLDNWQSQKI